MQVEEMYEELFRHWTWYKDHFGDNMDDTFKAILTFLAYSYINEGEEK